MVSGRLGNYLMPINVLSVCSEVFYQVRKWKLQELCKTGAGLGEEGTWLHFQCLLCYHILSHLWRVLVLWTLIFTLLIDPPKGSKASRLCGSTPGRSENPPEAPEQQRALNCRMGNVQSVVLVPPVKMLLFSSSWSVSQLKMRSKSENSEIWLPRCQESCWLALPLYLWLTQTGQRISICTTLKYVEQKLL